MLRSFKARAAALGAIVAGGLLVACDNSPSEQSSGKGTAANSRPQATTSAALPAQMVAAVAAGQSASSLGVHFSLGASPEVGKALPVEIAIVPHQEFAVLSARFEGYAALAVTSGMQLPSQTVAKAEKIIAHQLVVLPKEPGMHLLSAAVETEGGDGNVVRIFSIPLIVAPAGGAQTPKP